MKVSNYSVPQFQSGVASLMKEVLPIKGAYKLQKNLKKLEEEIKSWEEVKKKFLENYGVGESSEDGRVTLDMSRKEEWEKEFVDMMTIESEITPVSVDELGVNVNISVGDLMFLIECGFLTDV